MKAAKSADAQRLFAIKQGEELTPATEICHKAGVSLKLEEELAGLMPLTLRQLPELEDENSHLERIVVDLMMDREILRDAIRRSSAVRS